MNKELYRTVDSWDLPRLLEEGYELITQWTESISLNESISLSGSLLNNSYSLSGSIPIQQLNTKFLLKLTKEAQILYAPPNQPNAKEILSFGDQIENK